MTVEKWIRDVAKQVPIFGGTCPYLDAIELSCEKKRCPVSTTSQVKTCWELSPENLHRMCKEYLKEQGDDDVRRVMSSDF
jgi:hypothetical protein